MLRAGLKGCARGDQCWFHHSSAQMTPYSKMSISHVERNVVLSGCPRPQDRSWRIRANYPAPWPINGVSHLTQDGQSYAPTPQTWAVGPFKLSHIEGYFFNDGPRQLEEPLASSHRARLQTGQAPHAPPEPGNGPPVMTNVRQGPRQRTSSPKRSRNVTIETSVNRGDNTYDNFRRQKGAYNSWDEGADDMPSELPPKYVANRSHLQNNYSDHNKDNNNYNINCNKNYINTM